MANWLQLVIGTAEYTPGPYELYGATVDAGSAMQVLAGEARAPIAHVLPTAAGRYPEQRDGRLATTWDDPEQEATARLMADAPEMLIVLARCANLLTVYAAANGLATIGGAEVIEDVCAIIRRHVRIGCAPVDEYTHTVTDRGLTVEGTDGSFFHALFRDPQ